MGMDEATLARSQQRLYHSVASGGVHRVNINSLWHALVLDHPIDQVEPTAVRTRAAHKPSVLSVGILVLHTEVVVERAGVDVLLAEDTPRLIVCARPEPAVNRRLANVVMPKNVRHLRLLS